MTHPVEPFVVHGNTYKGGGWFNRASAAQCTRGPYTLPTVSYSDFGLRLARRCA